MGQQEPGQLAGVRNGFVAQSYDDILHHETGRVCPGTPYQPDHYDTLFDRHAKLGGDCGNEVEGRTPRKPRSTRPFSMSWAATTWASSMLTAKPML